MENQHYVREEVKGTAVERKEGQYRSLNVTVEQVRAIAKEEALKAEEAAAKEAQRLIDKAFDAFTAQLDLKFKEVGA